MGVRVGVANFFLGHSIDIDETNTFHLTFVSSMKILCATGKSGRSTLLKQTCAE